MTTSKGTRAPNGASSIYEGTNGRWHGRVTMGVRDDGTPDRRHVERKTRAEVTRAVRELEKQRDSGRVRKAGRAWTVEQWLTHWLDNIAAHSVRYKTLVGYRTDVTRHLVPGLGAHRIDKLEPEHVEKLYGRMIRSGLAAGTVHHAHRTLRASLSEAVKRKHAALNVAMVANRPDSMTRKSSRSPSRRLGGYSQSPASNATPPGGRSRSRSGCARARHSGCGGHWSTSPPASSAFAMAYSVGPGSTAAATPTSAARATTRQRPARPAADGTNSPVQHRVQLTAPHTPAGVHNVRVAAWSSTT
jgi:hypothetical protein